MDILIGLVLVVVLVVGSYLMGHADGELHERRKILEEHEEMLEEMLRDFPGRQP